MCGSTWSPANSTPACSSTNTTWPRVCPGVGSATSVRSPRSILVVPVEPLVRRLVVRRALVLVLLLAVRLAPPVDAVAAAPQRTISALRRCSRPASTRSIDGCSPMPSATFAPNVRRSATASV